MNVRDILLPEGTASLKSRIEELIEKGDITYEDIVIRKDRSLMPVEVHSRTIELGGRKLILTISRDITERKKDEEQLKLYSEHLEELVEERTKALKEAHERLLVTERLATIGEVAAMVGHDLRNPLQAIVNTLYLTRKKLESIPLTDREIMEKHGLLEQCETMKEQMEYMNKIVSDLQDYARPLKPKLVETSLNQLINESLSTITIPEIIELSTEVEEGFKLMVDPELMRRVFTNLVTNAIQAMPSGGKLTIEASKTEEAVFISLQDTGEGMPKENMDRLFQPFFTTKPKGMGLGLPICKRIVEAHGGAITVESEVGKGSALTVNIPFRREVSQSG